MDVTPYKLSFV